VGILTTDTDLLVMSWDAALERMTGTAASIAIGRSLPELVPDLEGRGLLRSLRETLVSGSPQALAPALHKFLIPCPTATPSHEFNCMQQRVVIGPLRANEGIVGLVITIEDVTERMESERALARELRHADPQARLAAIERLSNLSAVDRVGPLRAALADGDWKVRRSAVRTLAARRDRGLVDAVIAAVRDGHRDFSLLSSALQLLALSAVDFTSALTGLLHDSNPEVRMQAALALGTQRGPEAVSALLTALDDHEMNVRFHAIEALGRLGAPSAVKRILAIAESRDFFLTFPALDALVSIGDASVMPRLMPLLSDPMLAAPVADALAHLGDEHAVAPLVEALDRDNGPTAAIARALARIHQRQAGSPRNAASIEETVRRSMTPRGTSRVLEALRQTTGPDLRAIVIVVGWFRDAATLRALAQLLGAPELHTEIVEALVRFGSPAVNLLITRLGEEDAESKRCAVVGLGRIGDPAAVPALTALLTDAHRDVWIHAAGALARIGDARAFEPLLPLLGDEDAAVRQAAIGALNSIGHPLMAGRIRGLLADGNPRLRESAVRIAGYFGYAECLEDFLRRCADEDESVRAAVYEHLPFFDDPRAIEILGAAIDIETPRVRAAAAQALGTTPATEALPLLLRTLHDPDSWVRYFSCRSVGRHRLAFALPRLETLATTDLAPHVRVAAIEAIGAIGGEQAVRILSPIAADHGDVGSSAVRALGQTMQPGIVAPLRLALRAPDARRRALAAEALAASGSGEAIDLLREAAARDTDVQVVHASVTALAALAGNTDPVGRRAVKALVDSIAEPLRGQDAVDALSQIPPSAIPWLTEALQSDSAEIRRGVVNALGRLCHPVASAYIQTALDDGDAVVRRCAVASLSRLGTPDISRRLAIMARTDPSPDVRQAAALAAAQQDPGSRSAE
jgi:HEAT repeat protein